MLFKLHSRATFILILFLLFGCKSQETKTNKDFELVPAWAKDAVIYELFVRDFTPEGTFKAAEAKIPYLKDLGVDIVWLMPIYPIGEKGRKGTLGSPYSVKNYYQVNPEFGNKEDFRSLVQAVHQAGMKIIIGFVPNHSANDYVEMANHPDWLMRDANGNFTREVKEWSDITDFNYDNPRLRLHIIDIMKYWIEEFDIDGYRFDVAGMVPDDFWKQAIPEIRKVKPDLFLLAEWEDHKFIDFGFSADYSWKILHDLYDLRKYSKTVSQVVKTYQSKYDRYFPEGRFLNFIENHDEQRCIKKFGKTVFKPYTAFVFAMPGLPLLFMGQEFGDVTYNGSGSLFEKVTISWQAFDSTIFHFYKKLVDLRHNFPVNKAQCQKLKIDDQQRTMVIAETFEDKALLLILNFSNQTQKVSFSLPAYLDQLVNKSVLEWFSGKRIKLSENNEIPVSANDVKILLR